MALSSTAAARGLRRSHAKSQWSDTHRPASAPTRARGRRRASARRAASTGPSPSSRPSQTSGRSRTCGSSPSTARTSAGVVAAAVEHVQRLVDDARPQQPEPRVDREDVEGVVRDGAGSDRVDDSRASCRRSVRGTGPRRDGRGRRRRRGRAGRCRPSTPRPRAGRAGRRCRSRPRSASGTATRPRTCARARRGRRPTRARRRTRAASASRRRRRARARSAGTRSARTGAARRSWRLRARRRPQRSDCRERGAGVTSATPTASSGTPSAAPERSAVTTAPKTSTAVTSTACARASAAYQVATYAESSRPVRSAHPHCVRAEAEQLAAAARDGDPADEHDRAERHPRRGERPRLEPATRRLTRITSTAQSSVAARIIASPLPNATVPGVAGEPCLARRRRARSRATCAGPSRSRRSGTASSATQTTSVLWMNAACVAVARESPSKKRTNGTLPPTAASATSPSHCRRDVGRAPIRLAACERRAARATSRRTTPATAFFAVV